MSERQILGTLAGYLWPADNPEFRRRVVAAFGLLVASKLLNVQVCAGRGRGAAHGRARGLPGWAWRCFVAGAGNALWSGAALVLVLAAGSRVDAAAAG